MDQTRPNLGAIIKINWRFLWASLWGTLAWISWPATPGFWWMGILSVICGLIAWGLTSTNLRCIAQHYRRDRHVAKFNAKGVAPRADQMARNADLKKAGILR